MDIRQYLSSKNLEWKEVNRPTSGLQAVMNCPVCKENEQKFSISLTTGAFSCLHANNCGVNGSWYDFQRLFGDAPVALDGAQGKITNTGRPKTYQKPKPAKRFITPTGEHMEWLKERGFTEETISKYKVAMLEGDPVIALPYYKGGKLVNVKYRAISDKKFWQEKECEPVLFNRDSIASGTGWLVITEGEFDALALCQYGTESVSMPGGASNMDWIEHEWEWLNQFKEIILAFDCDDAGNDAAEKASQRLGTWRCRRVEWPDGHKDANECLIAGVPRAAISAALVEAKDYTPSVLLPASHFINPVIELIEHPEQLSGTPTAFDGLTKILGGWRYPEFTVWSGTNSSGKSTVLNQIVIDLVTRGIPAVVASLEMPAKRYLRWAVTQFTECTWPTPDRVKEAMARLGRYLYVVDIHEETEIEIVLDLFRYAARRYGCKHFVIDSLMMLKTDQRRELEQQTMICKKYVGFSKEFNVHAHLVAHPRKGADDDDMPGKVDISGTANIGNIADNVIIMWRPSEDLKEKKREIAAKKGTGEVPADALMIIKKNREIGTTGKVKLWFDVSTKRYSEEA